MPAAKSPIRDPTMQTDGPMPGVVPNSNDRGPPDIRRGTGATSDPTSAAVPPMPIIRATQTLGTPAFNTRMARTPDTTSSAAPASTTIPAIVYVEGPDTPTVGGFPLPPTCRTFQSPALKHSSM